MIQCRQDVNKFELYRSRRVGGVTSIEVLMMDSNRRRLRESLVKPNSTDAYMVFGLTG